MKKVLAIMGVILLLVISNIVVWSSGPNRINEYGLNDDVVFRNKPYPQAGENE